MDESIRVNLLLVDDKPANLVALKAVLDPLNCHLLEAFSGPQALEILETTDVALILLDVQMPGMDGFETARWIKKKFPEKNIPIFFISAVYTSDPYILKGYEVGGVDYFPKPFDPSVLRERVRNLTDVHKKLKLLQQIEEQQGKTAGGTHQLVDSLPDLVCVASADGKITFLNKAIDRFTGYQQAECIGKKFTTLLHEDDSLQFKERFEKAAREHRQHFFKARILTKSGKKLPVEVYLTPLLDSSGTQNMTCVVHDLSRRTPARDGLNEGK